MGFRLEDIFSDKAIPSFKSPSHLQKDSGWYYPDILLGDILGF